MARLPRYFLPDQPQHVIQRGNNRNIIFAGEDDYHFYLAGQMGSDSTYAHCQAMLFYLATK